MRNRFYIDADLTADAVVTLADEERHHARVLRVRDGEEVEVFNGRGDAFVGIFEAAHAVRLTTPAANREPPNAITLAMAIIQLDKFELVLQKATELGTASIIPLVTERCEVRPERYRGKHERWQKIIFEATKQSGRSRIATLHEAANFAEVIARPGPKVLFDADETPTTQQAENAGTLFVGPEGGWSAQELRLARTHDCAFQQLGPRRLRAETAGVVAIALAILRHS